MMHSLLLFIVFAYTITDSSIITMANVWSLTRNMCENTLQKSLRNIFKETNTRAVFS